MKPNIKRKTITYDHTRELSEETKAKYMDQVAMLQREKELLEEDKSETAKDFNAQIKGKEEQISDLCGRVRVGQENITITAYEVWDYGAGEIRIEHSGTGEVLERRKMTQKERQQELFQEEPAPEYHPSCLSHPPGHYPVRKYQAGPLGGIPTEAATPRISAEDDIPDYYLCDTCGKVEYADAGYNYPKGWGYGQVGEMYCPDCLKETEAAEESPTDFTQPTRSASWRHRLEQMIINAVNEGRMVDGYPDYGFVRVVFNDGEEPTEAEVREAFEKVRAELRDDGKEAA